MYGLYGYDEMGEELIETFETEEGRRRTLPVRVL